MKSAALPALLCALLIVGVAVSELKKKPNTEFVSGPQPVGTPTTLMEAAESLSFERLSPILLSNKVGGLTAQFDVPGPNAVPPLGLFLVYAKVLGMAPYDGTYLAVTAADESRVDEAR